MPWFPFYADDYIAGTITFSMAERGLYHTLLCIQWSKGHVTNDDVAQLGAGMAEPSVKRVLGKFKTGPDGNLYNERLEYERQKLDEFHRNRSESGKAGADKRWHSHSTAIAQPMAKHSYPHPHPHPTKLIRQRGDKALSAEAKELSERMEKVLSGQWANDAGKWVNRIKTALPKARRVIGEVECALREQRIETTPAQFAEDTWKRFA